MLASIMRIVGLVLIAAYRVGAARARDARQGRLPESLRDAQVSLAVSG